MSVTIHAVREPANAPHLDAEAQARLRSVALPVMPIQTLRRTGQRPFTFNGVPVATVCGVTPALPFWYELNVFQTVVGGFVADVRLFHKTDAADRFHVAEHDDLADVAHWFERYQPAKDVRSSIAPASLASRAELAIAIASLRLEVETVTEHYREQCGQLLAAIAAR